MNKKKKVKIVGLTGAKFAPDRAAILKARDILRHKENSYPPTDFKVFLYGSRIKDRTKVVKW